MNEENKIVTVVELDTQQAQQELVKLNATVSNSTKTLEERIEAKNKAVEIQNQLAQKTIKTLEENVKSLNGVIGKEREYEKVVAKLSSEKLKALKQNEQAIVQLDKLNQANDKVVAKTNAQEGAVKTLKTQLREAVIEQGKMAAKYGETSTEAIRAAKAVAELKDQVSFNADLVASFDPDQKFKALGAATEIAGTGIQGVTSGMALFGDTSAATEKALLQVQAAMSFSQALSQLSGLGDQYKIFKSTIVAAYLSITTAKAADVVATEASVVVENQSTLSKVKGTVATGAQTTATVIATGVQWLWNAAITANPIVALVVALAAAGAGIYYFTKMLMDSSEANDIAAAGTEKLEKSLNKESLALARTGVSVREKNKQTLAMAKANGDSSDSIRKLEKKLIDEQIATDKASATTARNTFVQERNNLAKLKASDASDEVIKAREKEVEVAYQTFQRENKQLDSSYKQRAQIVKDQEVEKATERTEAKKKAAEDRREAIKESEEAKKKAIKDSQDAKARREKEAKETYELKKREAQAAIDLAEVNLDSKKKKDPKGDTLQQEKDLLTQKKDFELMNTELLESEKFAIEARYAQMKVDLVTKTETDKREALRVATELEMEDKRLKLDTDQEIRRINFENESSTILEKNAFDIAQLQEQTNLELSNLNLTTQEKVRIQKEADATIRVMNKQADAANKRSVDQQASDGIDALAESFGIAKEVAVAKMIMAAPEAIGNSFKNAAAVYAPPTSQIMGALGAATTVVPIIKGLADIKKTRFPGKKGGGGSSSSGSISSSTGGGSVAKVSIGDLAANNAAQLGIDPSIKSAATSDASNNVLGSSSNNILFSEGKYSEFKKQVEFKETKTSI